MPRPKLTIAILIASLGWLLVACGQGTAVQPTATTAPPGEQPTTLPPSAQPLPAIASDYAGIPQGVTPEGYQYLGDPAAPLTLVMYSDFF